MSFYERYAECCRRKNIAPVSQMAAEYLGCTKANISVMARNGTSPKGDSVAGAARMLDISADYLLGLTDDPRPLHVEKGVSEITSEALSILYELNREGQTAALAMIRGLALQGIYKKAQSVSDDA